MKHLLACSSGWFNLWTLTRLIEEINQLQEILSQV